MRLLLHNLPRTQRRETCTTLNQPSRRENISIPDCFNRLQSPLFQLCFVYKALTSQEGVCNPTKTNNPMSYPLLLFQKSLAAEDRAQLTVCEGINWFSCNIQCCQTGALRLCGSPALQGCFQGRRPVTNNSQWFSLHRCHLASLRLGLIRVRLWN